MNKSFVAYVTLLSFILLFSGVNSSAQSLTANGRSNSISQNLVDFSGKTQNNTISLTWRTITQAEKEYFNIQRSKDAIEWEDIGKASSGSNLPNSFSFVDNNPSDVNVYYRLKIEREGNLEYSSMISVKFNSEINKTILFPNPTKNVIWIKSEQTMNRDNVIDLEVYNILGERVYASRMQDDLQKVDLTGYQDGYYYIKIGSKAYKILKE